MCIVLGGVVGSELGWYLRIEEYNSLKMKKILDRLIYVDNYDDIDKKMSDSNIGARKQRNIKDHLLIIHGVINSVIRGNEECALAGRLSERYA